MTQEKREPETVVSDIRNPKKKELRSTHLFYTKRFTTRQNGRNFCLMHYGKRF